METISKPEKHKMDCCLYETTPIEECECVLHRKYPWVPLQYIHLDCWQRELDKRPYQHFQIEKLFFEQRMKRVFTKCDWIFLFQYLELKKRKSIQISNIDFCQFKNFRNIEGFVKTLTETDTVKLINISLPLCVLEEFKKTIASSTMKNFDISQNQLTSKHLAVLRCILIHSIFLESLNVANCGINENNFPILADGIFKSKVIRRVDLSRPVPMSLVSIFDSPKYVYVISQLLWQNKLTHLSLGQSYINGFDVWPISEYLESSNTKLIYLDLQSNNLTSDGAEILFNALVKNKTLRTLNISTNNLGSRGAVVISRHFSFTSLEELDISHNSIGCDGMYEVLSCIKKPCELRVLKIFGNTFDSKTAAVLKRLLVAKVLEQDNVDVTYSWDTSKNEAYVIPYLPFERKSRLRL